MRQEKGGIGRGREGEKREKREEREWETRRGIGGGIGLAVLDQVDHHQHVEQLEQRGARQLLRRRRAVGRVPAAAQRRRTSSGAGIP
eukprot:SAG11_NODE_24_length_24699_cov_10.132195_20_plen_87_part_00